MLFILMATHFIAQKKGIFDSWQPKIWDKSVLPSPPAVEDWRWLTDFAVGRTAAAAES